MKLHEYQGRKLLKKYGVPIAKGLLVSRVSDIARHANKVGFPLMVKAQIKAGGRGKSGGIREAGNLDEAIAIAKTLLGRKLVTPQTPKEGETVQKLMLQKKVDIDRELYLAITIDRTNAVPVLVASKTGGVDIEETAQKNPERIVKSPINTLLGPLPFQVRNAALICGVPYANMATLILSLWNLFTKEDCVLVEINPLVIDRDGNMVALDAKIILDDNAAFRHKNHAGFKMYSENPLEEEAQKSGISYVALEGEVGCIVNGAGLAMATMDELSNADVPPANFLDLGGGANDEKIEKAFRILLSDENVKVVFLNIFGGILRCDRVASILCVAMQKSGRLIPLVARLEGVGAAEAKEILRQSNVTHVTADSLSDGARKAANFARSADDKNSTPLQNGGGS